MKVLYIHGAGGSSNGPTVKLLQEIFTNCEVFAIDYDECDPENALLAIKSYVKEHSIDLIIGSSLGGFLALNLIGYYRFVINPCLHPHYELKRLGHTGYEAYKELDETLKFKIDLEESELVTGFFGDKDELFSYKTEFDLLFQRSFTVSSSHRASKEALEFIYGYLNNGFLEDKQKLELKLQH